MPVRAATGGQPETSKTSNATAQACAAKHPLELGVLCRLQLGHSGNHVYRLQAELCGGRDDSGRYEWPNDVDGIDMPGVGVVRPGVSPDAPGEDSAGDGIPAIGRDPVAGASLNDNLRASVALRDMETGEQRERLFSQLIFASRDLAHEQIEPATEFESAFCTECGEDADAQGVIAHVPVCHAGRVLQIIADLLATLNLKPEQKEAANTDEEARAGDGIRPQGLEHFKELIKDLGDVVRKAHPDSAMLGLETVAAAFGCLLDVYAAPNPSNPAGMCDDNAAFRKFFAEIIEQGGAR